MSYVDVLFERDNEQDIKDESPDRKGVPVWARLSHGSVMLVANILDRSLSCAINRSTDANCVLAG